MYLPRDKLGATAKVRFLYRSLDEVSNAWRIDPDRRVHGPLSLVGVIGAGLRPVLYASLRVSCPTALPFGFVKFPKASTDKLKRAAIGETIFANLASNSATELYIRDSL